MLPGICILGTDNKQHCKQGDQLMDSNNEKCDVLWRGEISVSKAICFPTTIVNNYGFNFLVKPTISKQNKYDQHPELSNHHLV